MGGELVVGTQNSVGQELRTAGTLKPVMPRAAVSESQNNLDWLGPLDITCFNPLHKAVLSL